MARENIIMAAGGVVWRRRKDSGVDVLIVHRPSYDDWTFPKGKQDPGEDIRTTAVREIAEETGFNVRLTAPLPVVRYRVGAGPKFVHYWSARLSQSNPGAFIPNKEVDEIRWLRIGEAAELLTYPHDRGLLESFREFRAKDQHRTQVLVILRHSKARKRANWTGVDLDRPLSSSGAEQAETLAPILAAYGIERVVTSPAERCRATIAPFAKDLPTDTIVSDDRLAEEAKPSQTRQAMSEMNIKGTVVCSHRPVLGDIFAAIGLSNVDLAPGEGVVVHHRRGEVVATERIT